MRILRFLFVSVVALFQSSTISWNEDVIARHYVFDLQDGLNPNQVTVKRSALYYQALQLRNPHALLQHYLHSSDFSDQQKLQWLTQDNLVNHWQANWLLGQYWRDQGQLPQAKSWMKSALGTYRLNTERRRGVEYTNLLLQLADVLQQLKEYQAANVLLNDAVFVDEQVSVIFRSEAIFLRAKGLMLEGRLHHAKDLLDELFVRSGVSLIDHARVLRQHLHGLIYEQYQANRCIIKVQLLVSDYFQWRYAHQLLTKWKSQTHLSALPICFNSIQPFDPKPLSCRDKDRLRLSCNLPAMAKHLPLEKDVLPVVVHGQSGVANYNNGIVFTNLTKSFGVFVHELFHHFGFIDEYPLPDAIGQKVCNVKKPTLRGENLLVVPSALIKEFKDLSLYQRFSTRADTCDQFDSVAYKLSPQMTIMGYMDQDVPQVYIDKAKDKMLHRFNEMSNYQYAFALAYEQINDPTNYRIWLQKSARQGYGVAKSLLLE